MVVAREWEEWEEWGATGLLRVDITVAVWVAEALDMAAGEVPQLEAAMDMDMVQDLVVGDLEEDLVDEVEALVEGVDDDGDDDTKCLLQSKPCLIRTIKYSINYCIWIIESNSLLQLNL